MVYLDNSATTRPCTAAVEKATYMMTQCFGNPSSLHRLGYEAERELTAAREAVGGLLGVPAADILFTSGGTEANNLAVFGLTEALARRGKHIVTTALEHSSVREACDRLEQDGYEITRLSPDENGNITAVDIARACREDTVLVTVMLVNNETGAQFPIAEAVPLIRKRAPLAKIHCDAVQAAGKIAIPAARWNLDAVTVSAHKLHGIKGCGALYLRHGVRVIARAVGGEQERRLRGGTESAPLIAAFGAAIRQLPDFAVQKAHYETLRQHLLNRLGNNPAITWHLPQNGVPYIVHFSLMGLRSETVLHFLSEQDIFVSSGSACAKGAKSPVLAAMHLPAAEIDSAIRVSFDMENTTDDIDKFATAIETALLNLIRAERSPRHV